MRKDLVILFFMVVWVVLTVAGLLWSFHHDWPDFVHVDYGMPLTWATNTLSTFAGDAVATAATAAGMRDAADMG